MDFSDPIRTARRALRPLGGRPTRRALAGGALLVLAGVLGVLGEAHAARLWSVPSTPDPAWVTAGLLASCALAGVLVRPYPLLAVIVILPGAMESLTLSLLLVYASYRAGRRMRRVWPALTVFGTGLALWLALVLVLWSGERFVWVATVVTVVGNLALPWLVGVYRRQHQELSESGWAHARHLQQEQRLVADQARLRERSRIAQDMHDSLGHELSLIALRAGGLEVAPDLDERHRRSAGELRATAVSATERLREIIGILREDAEPVPLVPADEGVPQLVERARDSGMRVALVREGPVPDLPPMVDRAVHRVVQESLTNAAKYAPDAEVAVRLTVVDDERLEVVVTNAEPRGALDTGGQGGRRGLIGLRERVRLAGGTFASGPREGGWEVRATLPLVAAPTPDRGEGGDEAAELDQLHRVARRRVRGWTLALVVLPVVATVALLVIGAVSVVHTVRDSTLEPEVFDSLAVGTARSEAQGVLPDDTVDPETAVWAEGEATEGAECRHYRGGAGLFDLDPVIYRLCFSEGRLSSKAQAPVR
ncbi:signal transduction histidine kinase [Nocardiopsis sp. Huas11]|uniref:sensor histidine kinase n=1 Tax=Nocardiopsis sp. Huas11 TaxID=2183912 RepID=UPI000EAF48AE|nr:histidine kinase [Nocardiopsis sp. Huas11]RKS09966.1 signal transduction histidine kinase [Nocardiopsis sp. Huas11]